MWKRRTCLAVALGMVAVLPLAGQLNESCMVSALNSAQSHASAGGCRWSESSGEWLLTRHLPAGDVSGSLGHMVVPFLHRHGIPVSFISRPLEDVDVQLHIDGEATVLQLLEEIIRQEPGYRYAVIEGRIVIFPAGEEYRKPFEASRLRGATRARAMYFLLADLKARDKDFENLQMPTLRGGGGQTLYGDLVDIGGAGTIVEHLVSLAAPRPSVAFRILSGEGRLAFTLDWVRLVERIDVQAPSSVDVGAVVEPKVVGTLIDGTVVPLDGPQCGVEYEVTEGESLEMGDSGRAIARRTGASTLRVRYENNFAQINIVVKPR